KAGIILSELAAQDSRNLQWRHPALKNQLKLVELLLYGESPESAAPLLQDTLAKLDELVEEEPSSRPFAAGLAHAWRLEGLRRMLSGGFDALGAVSRAVDLGSALVENGRADHQALGEFAQACILAGRILHESGG